MDHDKHNNEESSGHPMETQPETCDRSSEAGNSGETEIYPREPVNQHATSADPGDHSGNHSSEEELEEINTNKKTYLEPERDCKRKWTDLSQSDASCESDTEFEDPELRLELCDRRHVVINGERSTSTSAGSSSCDTPSGDEESNLNSSSAGPEPVQFSTSPPVDVHKPRRSLSPPPFGFTNQPRHMGGATSHLPHSISSNLPRSTSKLGNLSSSLGDLNDLTRIESETLERRNKKTISPRKKSRTSRVHHIQRPCLDFEKMQQLRARAVINKISWRHGGELSLFCW